MKAIEILYNLNPYQNLLQQLLEKVQKEQLDKTWSGCLKSEYDFITLELKHRPVNEPNAYERLAQKIMFEIRQDKMLLNDVYCEDQTKIEEIESLIKKNKEVHDTHWHNNPNNTWYHNEQTTAYINIADEIAQAGSNCRPGDNYRPGAFSEIAITTNHIQLEQINHHNAKSTAHKDDYMLRDLIVFIPLKPNTPIVETCDYQIGDMCIYFLDRSSLNNKDCGNNIVERILQQQKLANQAK